MNVVCVICSDHLQPSDDIYYTPCGHVFHFPCVTQWLERSRTCPQCRDKVTQSKIHRIYFNFSNNDTIVEDSTSLQAMVDSLKFQVLVKEREVKQSNAKNDVLKKEASGLRAEVRKLESQLVERESAIYAFKEQLHYFKELSSSAEDAKKEAACLKKKLTELRSVQILINASGQEVDEMIQNTRDPETLIIYISAIKRQLTASVSKRKELRDVVKNLEQELTKVSMERNFLSEEHEHRKQLEEELILAEKRIREKNERIKELERMLPTAQKSNNSANRKNDGTKAAKQVHDTPMETDMDGSAKSLDDSLATIDLDKVMPIPRRKRSAPPASTENDVVDLTNSTEEEQENEENSPYYPFRVSHGLRTDVLKKNVKITSGPPSHSILMKKPRLAHAGSMLQAHRAPDLTYDGFGGHSKAEKFPSTMRPSLETRKLRRGPPKKGKLDDGNNKKLGDFVTS